MNGETLPRLVGTFIIKVAILALTKKLSIYVVWYIIMPPNNCTCVILQQYLTKFNNINPNPPPPTPPLNIDLLYI